MTTGFINISAFFPIVAGIALFVLLATFIIAYMVIFWKRKVKYQQEVERMKLLFKQEMLKSQIEIQEQTSNYISLEIHDNVGQILSLAKVQLNIMEETNVTNSDQLKEVKETITTAINDLRNIARSLNTNRLYSINLEEAAADQIDRINKTGFLNISIKVYGEHHDIENSKKLFLFRIIQESLQNIIKHSKASKATLVFDYTANELKISISDNGKGFNINDEQKSNGLGLQSIRNRAALIGCELNISSVINEGSTTTIKIPYD